MKVYQHDSVNGHSPNGTVPPEEDVDPLDAELDDESWSGEDGERDFSNLFGAPNYSSFIKTKPNSKAQTYEVRVASMMKAGMIYSLNAGNYPDAATFLKHGPSFAKATGNLAAVDSKIAGMVEILTAPESPYVMFALVAVPLIAQLWRNHEAEVTEAGATFREKRKQRKAEKKAGIREPSVVKPVKVKLFKREWTIPLKVRLKLPNFKNVFKAFAGGTQHPAQITNEVFGDPKVVAELHKMGLYPSGRPSEG